MLKDGEEAGVGVCVAQLLLDQFKHGPGTLSIYMGLFAKTTNAELLLRLTIAQLDF